MNLDLASAIVIALQSASIEFWYWGRAGNVSYFAVPAHRLDGAFLRMIVLPKRGS
jgi:hypothetical protein